MKKIKSRIKRVIDTHKIKRNNLTSEETNALRELQNNKNIVISRAGKDNVVEVQNKQDYDKK
jgi:hypothetical protein